ncbi:MAG: tetraprenyl-beta-curcumene synthase family protein [Syntrophomonadaceae bacterium]|nr:tetraprenyl-beta-curcumene synthase family protein [Syntrophomonadaceae bacterium]
MSIARFPWLYNYLTRVIPRVDGELLGLKDKANQLDEHELRRQAVSSLNNKAFHCYGGAVMALLGPPERWRDLINLIVTFQTISDYLDNLCDRAGIHDEAAFFRLHHSMLAAVTPGQMIADYYDLYGPYKDVEYLNYLVANCQNRVASLPGLDQVYDPVMQMVNYYAHLQAIKHAEPEFRSFRLQQYIDQQVDNPNGLEWWELAAATGSTLGIFALWAMAANSDCQVDHTKMVYEGYFPWINGMHILLDYLIDQGEDEREGDLNFVSYYPDAEDGWKAIRRFSEQSLVLASRLPSPGLHMLVVNGLLAMYLSDEKVRQQGFSKSAHHLLDSCGQGNHTLYYLCRGVRTLKSM